MVDIDLLTKAYFMFDKPVPYKVCDNKIINIVPVCLADSIVFSLSATILQLDKNSSNSVEIIQMSYLKFIVKVILQSQNEEANKDYAVKFINIMKLCLGIDKFEFIETKDKDIFIISDNIKISEKQFDEIIKIILYQNILEYDDSYIDPNFKKSMEETNALRNANKEMPSIEKKIAIISSHTGITKKEQLEMTLRSHSLLFQTVQDEVDFVTLRPIALFGGKGNELDHWIYKNKKNKFDGYMTSVENFNKQMGGNGEVKTVIAE